MMTRIISVLLVLLSSVVLSAQGAGAPLELAADAPNRHVVVPGDTLWGISATFLKDPYRWNELWRLNADEVKNPQRIYPGQVLVLDTSGGDPRLRIEGGSGGIPTVKVEPTVRITQLNQEIPAIPQQVIEPFLSQPLVEETEDMKTAPRIVAIKDNREIAAPGDLAYVSGIKAGSTPRLWQIYRPGKELKDPESGDVLGYEAVYLGSARLVENGEPATIRIVTSRQEITRNNRLVLAPRPDIVSYPLHRPQSAIKARVISIYGDNAAGAGFSIIAISGGKEGGLEVGNVLALSRTGQTIADRYEGRKQDVTLPNEKYGLLYVFRNFQKVSYAMVMTASQTVAVGDSVSTP